MANRDNQVRFFHSLRTQLWLGTLLLMAITVSAISYLLIVHEEKMLTRELEKAVVLQGRNIALSSQKALLHVDPEIELFPLVTRIMEDQDALLSVTITDAEGIAHGDGDIAARFNNTLPYLFKVSRFWANRFNPTSQPIVRPRRTSEHCCATAKICTSTTSHTCSERPYTAATNQSDTCSLRTRNRSCAITSPAVFDSHSRCSAALVLGLILALIFFQRISRPMNVLMEGVNTVAGGNLDTTIRMPTRNEFRVLADAFNEMAFRIAAAQQEHIVKERMDRELEIARDIQRTLLPERVHVPDGYQIGHYYDSATEVGGDYLDVVRVGQSKVGLVMADVSGKGVPGLVIMAMIKIM